MHTVCGNILAKCAKYPLYTASNPSVLTVLLKQSQIPEYKFPVWLYILLMTVSGGCMTQHTTNPLMALEVKCVVGEFGSIPICFSSLLFAKKYVGS